ncbi:unnamed protein product, partial [Iphiclides podalirius]
MVAKLGRVSWGADAAKTRQFAVRSADKRDREKWSDPRGGTAINKEEKGGHADNPVCHWDYARRPVFE